MRKTVKELHDAVFEHEKPGFEDRAFSPCFTARFTREIEVVKRPVVPGAVIS